MAYNTQLAERIREYLARFPKLAIEEKAMFSGLAFLVNGKMCINVSGDRLMCRYDMALQTEVAERNGYQPMVMKGKEMNGYCYVDPSGYNSQKDFAYWMDLCLAFNHKAISSKKRRKQ